MLPVYDWVWRNEAEVKVEVEGAKQVERQRARRADE
jgi:hypothetical protein